MARADARGFALVDVILTCSLLALVSATTIPVVAGALEGERAWLGAQFLAARVAHTQLEALRRNAFVALRVELSETDATLQMFADGNGNGVLASDIADGVDLPVGVSERLGTRADGVRLRINQRVRDASGAGWLDAGSDPLRIGSSALVSCSPAGSLTSGTLYVASARGPQYAVRITGTTGRVRVLRFDQNPGEWRP